MCLEWRWWWVLITRRIQHFKKRKVKVIQYRFDQLWFFQSKSKSKLFWGVFTLYIILHVVGTSVWLSYCIRVYRSTFQHSYISQRIIIAQAEIGLWKVCPAQQNFPPKNKLKHIFGSVSLPRNRTSDWLCMGKGANSSFLVSFWLFYRIVVNIQIYTL